MENYPKWKDLFQINEEQKPSVLWWIIISFVLLRPFILFFGTIYIILHFIFKFW